jgi:hypothetical protein
MAKHPEPRWMTLLWLVVVLCIVGSFLVAGLRRGYDFVEVVGFLGVNFGNIFALSLLAALVPYAVSFILGLLRRRLHSAVQ